MATYKLIQDVEAEDHILGPLTLRQFIYGLIAALLYYVCFVIITKHIAILLILFLPPALFATFFAFPFKRDQPTEVWALAKLRFLLKPRRRIWSQSGVKDLVSITVPKKIEHPLTNGLSQTEVKSRLQALAMTLDTRGWAVKNLNVIPPNESAANESESDRLISVGSIPKPVPDYDVTPNDDMLDDHNPQSQQIAEMITESTKESRRELLERVDSLRRTDKPNPALEHPSEHVLSNALKAQVAKSGLSTSRMHTIGPKKATPTHTTRSLYPATTSHIDPAKFSYLFNPGLSIQTVAHEVHRNDDDNEVVVKLNH